MNPSNLRSIEKYLDAPRGTLEHWLAEEPRRSRARHAGAVHGARSRRGGWLARLGLR